MKLLPALGLILFWVTMPVLAQEHESTNNIMILMKNRLNLSDDQVAGITQVIDRYADQTAELQKSIADGTSNPSAVDSQKQQFKAAEDQGIAQYLRPDQLSQWQAIESQMAPQDTPDNSPDNRADNADADKYSNFPQNNPSP